MKHVKYFRDFLANEVNLNQTRLDTLNSAVLAATGYLSKHLDSYTSIERQGSYALRTIIKPVNGREFDADVLLYMEYDKYKEPKEYINELYTCLKENKNYEDKVHRRTRCVYIDYAGDFHLDIVPCVTQEQNQYVCNNKNNEFEPTDGTGYRDWFNDKTKITNGHLKRITRLLKYLRDHKGNFSVKSILLTTLIGEQIDDDECSEPFNSIPNTMEIVSVRLNDFLQDHKRVPKICNPVLPEEDFTRYWDQIKYENFREKFDLYTGLVNEAFEAEDHNTSIKKWRELFGDEFGELKDDAASVAAQVTPRKPYAW